jgi:hypothetical protein
LPVLGRWGSLAQTILDFVGAHFGFELSRIFVQFVKQRPRRFRNGNFAGENVMTVDFVAVHGFVSALVGLNHGAIESHTSENTLCARIGQNLRGEFNVGASFRGPADGSGCD